MACRYASLWCDFGAKFDFGFAKMFSAVMLDIFLLQGHSDCYK